MIYQLVDNLLKEDLAAELLAYAMSSEASFVNSVVGSEGQVDQSIRMSRRLVDLGRFVPVITDRVLAWVPALIQDLRLTPFAVSGLEMELVAHGHGAFYKRHIDLFTGMERAATSRDRLISLVCYLNEEPKVFTGGELRLYPQSKIGKLAENDYVDIIPEHGRAVAFSSWMPHEVRPINCTSREFRHARFAVNCWVLRSPIGT